VLAASDISPRAFAAHLLAASTLCVVPTLAPSASAMAQCTLEPSVLFAYPSLETETTLPRNAALLFVTAGTVQRTQLLWPSDLTTSRARGNEAFDRYVFDVGDRLTPGAHDVELYLEDVSNSVLVGPDTLPLRFTVADVVAPPPDASGSAVITRVFTYGRRVGGIVRTDTEAMSAAADDPTDCSREVALQEGCGASGWGPLGGDHRVELEAEGSVLGFALNERYFLPAHCRSAFVRESSGPYSIRVVTETGLGSLSEFTGEVGLDVSDAPDPLDYPEAPAVSSCNTAARGAPSSAAALAAALLLGLVAARRRAARASAP